MGLIRGGLFVITSVLLFILFLAGNVFLTLDKSLEYEVVKSELVPILKDIVENEINLDKEIEEKYPSMELYCQNNSEFVFSGDESGQVFVIPCDIISQGSDAVIEYGINVLVEEFYYKDYDCNFWDCLGKAEIPFFLVSKKAKDYWNNKFYLSVIISLILIVLMFFFVEQKSNLFVVTGSLLAVSALPFMKLNWVLSFVSDKSFLQFFTIFFSKAHTVFLISFIIGLVILGIGILLKFFGIGFKISELIDKFSKKSSKISKKEQKEKIVDEKVSKKKSK